MSESRLLAVMVEFRFLEIPTDDRVHGIVVDTGRLAEQLKAEATSTRCNLSSEALEGVPCAPLGRGRHV